MPLISRTALARPVVVGLVFFGAIGITAQEPDHATSGAFNRALGVECRFCHAPPGDDERPAYATARRMMAMVTALNERLTSVRGTVTCWTCHAGSRVPSRIDRALWENELAAWPKNVPRAPDNVMLTMAIYTASVGRTCVGCHEADGAGPATVEAVALVRTMNSLFDVMPKYLPPTARTQCYMCHKGRPHPQRNP